MSLARHLAGIVTAFWLLLGIAGSAWASPFDDAGDAYQRGDYETAFELLKPLADKGNADAQFTIGLMYELGQGITQNYDEAMKWYRLSADQGNVASQFNLAVIYYIGAGVPSDDTEAAHWYALAAKTRVSWPRSTISATCTTRATGSLGTTFRPTNGGAWRPHSGTRTRSGTATSSPQR